MLRNAASRERRRKNHIRLARDAVAMGGDPVKTLWCAVIEYSAVNPGFLGTMEFLKTADGARIADFEAMLESTEELEPLDEQRRSAMAAGFECAKSLDICATRAWQESALGEYIHVEGELVSDEERARMDASFDRLAAAAIGLKAR